MVDVDGKMAATTSEEMESGTEAARDFADSPADSQEVQGYQFFKVFDEGQLEYILVAGGAGEDIYTIGKMAAFQIQTLLVAYKERFDKDNFIKNLLLDNLLLVDIYSRAKKLRIPVDVERTVLLIEADESSGMLTITGTDIRTHIQRRLRLEHIEESGGMILKPILAEMLYLLTDEFVELESCLLYTSRCV